MEDLNYSNQEFFKFKKSKGNSPKKSTKTKFQRRNNYSKIHTKWEIKEEEYSKIVLTNVLEIHINLLTKVNTF